MIERNRTPVGGFTLIELLVVIGILAVLLAIVLVAINPDRQFKQANDTQRKSDVNAILNAISQYMADNKGDITALGIPTGTAEVIDSTNSADLCTALVPTYIAALPVDPTSGSGAAVAVCSGSGVTWNTAYTVVQNTAGRITVAAPGAQIESVISVTR